MQYTFHFEQVNAQAITVEAEDEDKAEEIATQKWIDNNQPNVIEVEEAS